MRIGLFCVGRPRPPLAEAIERYEQRISRYFRFEVVEVKETPHRGQPTGSVIADEGQRLLARIPPQAELVALDRLGIEWSSEELADYLAAAALRSVPVVAFVIGGAYGIDAAILARSAHRLSLSAMTLPHEVARLVLAEQLYRAGTIHRSEPYHKGREEST